MNASARPLQLEPGWASRLGAVLRSEPLQHLRSNLLERSRAGAIIYPAPRDWFAAFQLTPFDAVRVVILGQDPYHQPGQAHGLSFSVPATAPPPPSLRSICREVADDLGIDMPRNGCLRHWAEQGVLLLNTVLTVERGAPGAHRGLGWELLSARALESLSTERDVLVFMLWGSHAREHRSYIDTAKHLVLEAPHPSPRSADRGFFGCRHFSRANAWLQQHGDLPIDWSLPDS